MKIALVQQAVPASNTTLEFTDAGISSDLRGAIFFGSSATANATNTAQKSLIFGAYDGTRQYGYAETVQDNTAGAHAGAIVSATYCTQYLASNFSILQTAIASTLSNGVRLTFTNNAGGSQRLMNCLMFSGSDIEFGASEAEYASGDTTKTITHNLSGTPDAVIVVFSWNNVALDNVGSASTSFGFYDGTNSYGHSHNQIDISNPTAVGARIGEGSDIGRWLNTSTPVGDSGAVTIGSVGATTLAVARPANVVSGHAIVVAWRHLSTTAAALASSNTTPNATGNNVVATGMAVAPQLWINCTSRATVTTLVNGSDDSSGSWGFSAAVNNNGSTQQMSVAGSTKVNVATSVAKAQVSNTNASTTLDTNGALQFASTVQSWDSGGLTENVGTAPATAFRRVNLLYGIAPPTGASYSLLSSPGPGISPDRLQQFTEQLSSSTPFFYATLTGVTGTGSVGTVVQSESVALSGITGTSDIGSVFTGGVPSAITGVSSTASVGSVVQSESVALVGVIPQGLAGVVTPSGGINAFASFGSIPQPGPGLCSPFTPTQFSSPLLSYVLPPGTGGTAALTGVTGTGTPGTIASTSTSGQVFPTGVSGTSGVGAVTDGLSLSLVGVRGTASLGTALPVNTIPLTGLVASGATGAVTVGSSPIYIAALTGVTGTGGVGIINKPISGIIVPNVVGINWYMACDQLVLLNLIPAGPDYSNIASIPPEIVTAQDTAPGTGVSAMSPVRLTVNNPSHLLSFSYSPILRF